MPASVAVTTGASLERVDTLDLKDKLNKALGSHSTTYWQSLREFCSARLSRAEFEEAARRLLKPEQLHLHNSLLLGLLYNASPGVPGPSTASVNKNARKVTSAGLDAVDDEINPRKRIRYLVAGLNKQERLRLKNLGKAGKGSFGVTAAEKANLDWAGAGADMLEKKRREDERKRNIEERRRYREAQTAIGAKSWKTETLQEHEAADFVRGRLALPVSQALARGLSTPLCVHTKELPSIESLRDRMTMRAVEHGLLDGVHPQAAALLLTALQSHLQAMAGSAINRVRSDAADASTSFDSADQSMQDIQVTDASRDTPAPIDLDHDDSPAPRLLRADGSPLRTLVPDMSFRTSLYGSSLGDTSMISMVSTAPTSFAPGSTTASVISLDPEGAQASDAGQTPNHETERPRTSTGLSVSSLAFLFEASPTAIVEPYGLGTSERLLAPDWEEEEVDRQTRTVMDIALARSARETSTAKMPAAPANAGAELLASETVTSQARARFAIDQSAPLRILNRRSFAQTQALDAAKQEGKEIDRPTLGGLSLSNSKANGVTVKAPAAKDSSDSATTGSKRKEGNKNSQLWEVVDPVALLANI